MKKFAKNKIKFVLKHNNNEYSFATVGITNDLSFTFSPSFASPGYANTGKFSIDDLTKIIQTELHPQEIKKGIHCSLHPNLEKRSDRYQVFQIKNHDTGKYILRKNIDWHPVQKGVEIFRFFLPFSNTYLKRYSKKENNVFYIPIQDTINLTQSILLKATVYPLNTDRDILISDIESTENPVFELVPNEGLKLKFWQTNIDCTENERQIGYTILFSFHRIHINEHPMFLWN